MNREEKIKNWLKRYSNDDLFVYSCSNSRRSCRVGTALDCLDFRLHEFTMDRITPIGILCCLGGGHSWTFAPLFEEAEATKTKPKDKALQDWVRLDLITNAEQLALWETNNRIKDLEAAVARLEAANEKA